MALTLRLELGPPEEHETNIAVSTAVPVITELSRYINDAWVAARSCRSRVTQEIYIARRERDFKYDPTKLAAIQETGGSQLFIGLTDYKCRMMTAFLRDLLLGQGEKAWAIEPTPIPNLPVEYESLITEAIQDAQNQFQQITGEPMTPEDVREYRSTLEMQLRQEIQSDARKGAQRMEDAVEDTFVEGGFYDALSQCIDDLTTAPACVMKGPIVKQKPELKWTRNNDGVWSFDVEKAITTEWQRVDPALVFPAENSKGVNHRYLCEVSRMQRRELENMKNTPGVNDQAIDQVLEEHAVNGLNNWLGFSEILNTEMEIEFRHPEATFDVLIFWGDIDGKLLTQWGMAELDPTTVYSACVYMIGRHIIKARLNFHPLDHKPYHVTSFDKRPGEFWGRSVAEVVRPIADMANANARALANNMGIASGPQVDVNTDRLAKGQNTDTMEPWKRWYTRNDPGNNNTPAIRFFQPDDRAAVLITVFKFWSELADEYLGLTKLVAGQANVGGAGRTASGLSMLLNNANKFVKQVILNLDADVLESAAQAQYIYIMQYGNDDTIKADIKVRARGAIALAIKDALQLRRQEFLAVTGNPIDMEIMGTEGRANLLREVAKTLDMDVDRIIPPSQVEAVLNQLRDAPTAQNLLASQQQNGLGQGLGQGQPQIAAPTASQGVGQLGSNEVLPGTATPTTDFFSPSSVTSI